MDCNSDHNHDINEAHKTTRKQDQGLQVYNIENETTYSITVYNTKLNIHGLQNKENVFGLT